jgi:hypothetical protein
MVVKSPPSRWNFSSILRIRHGVAVNHAPSPDNESASGSAKVSSYCGGPRRRRPVTPNFVELLRHRIIPAFRRVDPRLYCHKEASGKKRSHDYGVERAGAAHGRGTGTKAGQSTCEKCP